MRIVISLLEPLPKNSIKLLFFPAFLYSTATCECRDGSITAAMKPLLLHHKRRVAWDIHVPMGPFCDAFAFASSNFFLSSRCFCLNAISSCVKMHNTPLNIGMLICIRFKVLLVSQIIQVTCTVTMRSMQARTLTDTNSPRPRQPGLSSAALTAFSFLLDNNETIILHRSIFSSPTLPSRHRSTFPISAHYPRWRWIAPL